MMYLVVVVGFLLPVAFFLIIIIGFLIIGYHTSARINQRLLTSPFLIEIMGIGLG